MIFRQHTERDADDQEHDTIVAIDAGKVVCQVENNEAGRNYLLERFNFPRSDAPPQLKDEDLR